MTTDKMDSGKQAEDFVAREMIRRGYTILERNYKIRRGEIDIIARKPEEYVFVEVRSRGKGVNDLEEEAAQSVRKKKKACIKMAAQYYLSDKPVDYQECRFFLACVGWYDDRIQITIIEDAM